uniref:Uncharacterized protein n=1 Tax=Cucumis melo TaxID=3656 RepID=A0A9I9ELG0_CUCME
MSASGWIVRVIRRRQTKCERWMAEGENDDNLLDCSSDSATENRIRLRSEGWEWWMAEGDDD